MISQGEENACQQGQRLGKILLMPGFSVELDTLLKPEASGGWIVLAESQLPQEGIAVRDPHLLTKLLKVRQALLKQCVQRRLVALGNIQEGGQVKERSGNAAFISSLSMDEQALLIGGISAGVLPLARIQQPQRGRSEEHTSE